MTEKWPDQFNVVFANPVTVEMINWSRMHFASMKDGGTWAVPRSGMIFQKKGNTLILTARMPHDPSMAITVDELDEQQHREYANIKRHFEAAGITVIWSVPRKSENKRKS